MFSNLSSSSISLATVTPSLVMRGAPYDLSRMTLRPLGPRVTLTALLRISTPRSIRSRASEENRTSLADMVLSPSIVERGFGSGGLLGRFGCDRAFDHAHDVGLLHDQELLAVDFDLRARPLAEQDTLARLEFDRRKFATLVACAGSDRNDLALLRLLLDGVGNDDPAFRLLLALNSADDDAVVQRTEFHGDSFLASREPVRGERLLSPTFRSPIPSMAIVSTP